MQASCGYMLKKIHKNGSVKHIKCIHCGKTFSYNGGSTSNALSHLYRNHFNRLMPSMESTKRPRYTYELKCEIIKKLKDGIKRSKIQKDYGIHAGTLSKWLKSADKIEGKVNKSTDKIVDKVNGEIQPVPEEDTENSQHNKENNIDIINKPHKCNRFKKKYNQSADKIVGKYEINAEENRKKHQLVDLLNWLSRSTSRVDQPFLVKFP